MEYNKLTLKDIEKACEQVYKEPEPLFEVIKDESGLYKICCGNSSILCSGSLLWELEKAIRKGLGADKLGKLEYSPLK